MSEITNDVYENYGRINPELERLAKVVADLKKTLKDDPDVLLMSAIHGNSNW
eukprot:CAMPEP_0170354484 /NCGR_PEP_ID=MMETSP0117_2-20130122/130_1 /TAXON_ID=400756 /ORGANISM="Durinskia baltica, Strain CSIRO CS-38" /LENGTH=51 /DNA_ID=CAMNT_0010608451 /DNA_START=21 /DNA_END=173 /DNA_ORIENTATION=-